MGVKRERLKALLLLIRDLQDDLLNISSYHGMAVVDIQREIWLPEQRNYTEH